MRVVRLLATASLLLGIGLVSGHAASAPITRDNVSRLVQIARLPIAHGVAKTLFFSQDGATLITGNVDGEVLFWDTTSWTPTVFSLQQQEISLHAASIDKTLIANFLAVSPDGEVIALSHGDEQGTVVVKDRTGQVLFATPFGAPVYQMLFSPDNARMVVAGLRTTIQVFDTTTWSLVVELTGSYEFVSNLLFSQDGKTLIASYERPANVIKTWDMATFTETASFTHVAQRIDYHALVHAPNGHEIVLATTEEEEIHFIDLATHGVTRVWNRDPNGPYEIAFSADGSLMVSASDRMLFWDAATGDVLRTISSMSTEAGTVAFSPDGTLLFLTVWEEGIQVWGIAP